MLRKFLFFILVTPFQSYCLTPCKARLQKQWYKTVPATSGDSDRVDLSTKKASCRRTANRLPAQYVEPTCATESNHSVHANVKPETIAFHQLRLLPVPCRGRQLLSGALSKVSERRLSASSPLCVIPLTHNKPDATINLPELRLSEDRPVVRN